MGFHPNSCSLLSSPTHLRCRWWREYTREVCWFRRFVKIILAIMFRKLWDCFDNHANLKNCVAILTTSLFRDLHNYPNYFVSLKLMCKAFQTKVYLLFNLPYHVSHFGCLRGTTLDSWCGGIWASWEKTHLPSNDLSIMSKVNQNLHFLPCVMIQ